MELLSPEKGKSNKIKKKNLYLKLNKDFLN